MTTWLSTLEQTDYPLASHPELNLYSFACMVDAGFQRGYTSKLNDFSLESESKPDFTTPLYLFQDSRSHFAIGLASRVLHVLRCRSLIYTP